MFNKLKSILFVATLPYVALAGESEWIHEFHQQVKQQHLSQEMSPAQIISDAYAESILSSPNKLNIQKVEIELGIPMMTNGKIVINDATGLPAHEGADEVLVKVPFKLNLDSDNIEASFWETMDNIDQVTYRMRVASQLDSSDKTTIENLPNCGGLPLGSTVNVTTHHGWPLCKSISSHYTCKSVNGQNNWIQDGWVEVTWPCNIEP